MHRTGAERRHHRERVIARRLLIIKNCRYLGIELEPGEPRRRPDGYYSWGRPLGIAKPWIAGKEGRLAKFNLVCSCWACKGPRYHRASEQRVERHDYDNWDV